MKPTFPGARSPSFSDNETTLPDLFGMGALFFVQSRRIWIYWALAVMLVSDSVAFTGAPFTRVTEPDTGYEPFVSTPTHA